MEDPSNYSVPQGETRLHGVVGGGGMSVREERTWSVLSHLSVFVNLFTGLLGPVAALIVWLVYKDRSPKVAFHALQSLWNKSRGW